MHTLRADGIHDDSAVLQAWIDGDPVALPDGTVQHRAEGQLLRIPEGATVLIAKTLQLDGKRL